jgi:high-affinity iron transporter
MLAAAIVVFREALEAALIIGVLAAATRGLPGRGRWLTGGIAAGALGSVLVALLAGELAQFAEGAGQEIFDASVLGLAVLMLAWHNVWMSGHGAQLARDARRLGKDLGDGSRAMAALGVVAAISVLREGSETVLFLYGLLAGAEGSAADVAEGGALGLAMGAAAGLALYAGLLRIPARAFFQATGAIVLLVAAALAGQMARTLAQAGIVPALGSPLWDTSRLLSNESAPGAVLHRLVGYDAAPLGVQVLFYAATLATIGTAILVQSRTRRAPAVQPA